MKAKLVVVSLLVMLATSLAGGAYAASPGYGTVNLANGVPITPLTGTTAGSPAYVTDGTIENYWMSFNRGAIGPYGFQQTLNQFTIDLGQPYNIGRIDAWLLQTMAFQISSSTDGLIWTVRHSYDWIASSGFPAPQTSPPVTIPADGSYTARYLKYEGSNDNWNEYAGVYEFQVYEWLSSVPPVPDLSGLANLASGMPVFNGPNFTSVAGHEPTWVTDGSLSSYWQGSTAYDYCTISTNFFNLYCGSAHWFNTSGQAYVDLGAPQTIQAIRLTFPPGAEGAQSYFVSLTDNSTDWSSTTGYPAPSKWWGAWGDPELIASNPAATSTETRTFLLPAPVTARYVWVGIQNWATQGVVPPGLAEVEVFGELPPPVMSYTITASAGAGGSISPSGAVTVNSGANQAFSIAPGPGYHIADVLVDGGSVGAADSYPFTNVTANHTIAASFAINTYTLTYTAGPNGTISGTSPQTVTDGANGSQVTATANPGYHFLSWSDGVLTAARTDTNVTGNLSVTASFAINTANVPKSKDDCKNGGWQSLTRADGSPFKNQGDCVSYVNTGK